MASASSCAATHTSLSFTASPCRSSTLYAGMRWPHQSCRLMHQSWMFSSQRYHVFSCSLGRIDSSPVRTASTARCAASLQSTYHCGFSSGSTMSPVRVQTGICILLSSFPMSRPISTRQSRLRAALARSSSSFTRTSKRIMPVYGAPFSLMRPSSLITLMNSK